LDFADVQEVAAVAGDVPATIANAIGKIENVDGYPNGIAMNPLDFWGQVATRHANQFDGQGINSGGIPYTAPPMGIWGLPTVRTRSLDEGSAVVGDWRLGATLFDREQTVIRSSDSHDDYFVLNKTAILAEERVALAVHRPDFFCDVTLDLTA
jgi:HK97 family phage major capsid protein